jgi:hypothetical protein
VDNRVFKSINKNYSWDKKHRLALVSVFLQEQTTGSPTVATGKSMERKSKRKTRPILKCCYT